MFKYTIYEHPEKSYFSSQCFKIYIVIILEYDRWEQKRKFTKINFRYNSNNIIV